MTETVLCCLTEEEREFAATYLKEEPHTRSDKIIEIREWILSNNELHARTDDFSILRFLRACKFDMEKAKRKIHNFHKLRLTVPQWFGNRDPFLPELQELLELGLFLPLLKRDKDGKMVVIIRATIHDTRKHKHPDTLKVGMMILDFAIRECKLTSLYGITAILDLSHATLEHALQLTPTVVRKLVHSWQDCYPLRIKSIDFINAPSYVNVVLNIFRQFMNQKLKQRMHVHRHGVKSLLKKVPAEILPAEYGGTDGTLAELIDYWKRTAEENASWFAEEEKYKLIDENSVKEDEEQEQEEAKNDDST